jgi:chorismate synthase
MIIARRQRRPYILNPETLKRRACALEILGGPHFAVTGAGESHGPAVTTIVHGCPAGLELSREAVQVFLDRRRPGSNKLGTPRREADKVVLLSGLYNEDHDSLLGGAQIATHVEDNEVRASGYERGSTTGEPIAAVVLSAARRSADYTQFLGPEGDVRPGHTDLVKHFKSGGFADPRGGGRSSNRSTISDVIGGSVARLFLEAQFGTILFTSICQVGELSAAERLGDVVEELLRESSEGRLSAEAATGLEERLDAAPLRSVDSAFADQAAELIERTRRDGDSVGAALEVVAVHVPALVGEPLYDSLKLRLMGALGGLHAVQSCEIGAGGDVVARRGSANNDPIRSDGYQSNHHGGLLGGITTGKPLVMRVGFKPTSTIAKPQNSVRKDLTETDFQLQKGRHDPCVGVRAGVILESRMSIELMNAVLAHQSSHIDPAHFRLFGDQP